MDSTESKIFELSHKLREEGFSVSIRSTQTAIDAYYQLGDKNKSLLKDALRSVYVKDKYDIPKFNELFEEYFIKPQISETPENFTRGTGMVGGKTKLKSNKYIIKKKNNKQNGYVETEMGGEQLLEQLSGQPVLEERDENLARDGELLNKDLTKLNKYDQRVFELCQELGKRIANKRSRRNSLATSHKIDIRRTMRTNMKYGGVPIDLVKVKPRPHKNQHLFLNDVSGSCEWISSWFFMLMYACQSAFKNSRVFEFDNKVIETTDFLKEQFMINAFAEVRSARMKNGMVHGTSNMYTAFKSFMKQADLNNKSYVIILSDCRDWSGPKNEDKIPASVDLISEIAKVSKKVIILNPEDKYKWDVVDSCVSLYEEAGAKTYEVNSLNQLADFVATM